MISFLFIRSNAITTGDALNQLLAALWFSSA